MLLGSLDVSVAASLAIPWQEGSLVPWVRTACSTDRKEVRNGKS